jgi:5-methylcytosine-specific restriction enzyme subunit McrC
MFWMRLSVGKTSRRVRRYRVFEKFVANFYKTHLEGWAVSSQTPLKWPAALGSPYLPALNPDLVLRHRSSGRIAVLDTKFTPSILTEGRWGNWTFNRDHLFQIYAYLRSQEAESESHATAAGVLLYPTVKHNLSEVVELQGHRICWETVDLSKPWQDVAADLLSIPGRAMVAPDELERLNGDAVPFES